MRSPKRALWHGSALLTPFLPSRFRRREPTTACSFWLVDCRGETPLPRPGNTRSWAYLGNLSRWPPLLENAALAEEGLISEQANYQAMKRTQSPSEHEAGRAGCFRKGAAAAQPS
ncbi:hypothetical protein GQ53DRAFT_326715 [Thozetella sp. PMI_491]|nr:hypothetical protein GQ53DRAFT_326715 [Thozetella sp. PMI_491]